MKTITFYSYKGGVGRSLALSNIAKRLSEFGKKVCLIDFDLEAPGLHHKFKANISAKEINQGLVDYIHHFTTTKTTPESLDNYIIKIRFRNRSHKEIDLIAAGNINSQDYWRKLASINWNNLFYDQNSFGIELFLDLKNRIYKDINPDFLLIDSRTGITEISGITMSLLADEVVILAANNEENIEGSKQIIKTLSVPENNFNNVIPKINFVLCRIPYARDPQEKPKEIRIRNSAKRKIEHYLNSNNVSNQIEKIFIIHSDPELEFEEKFKMGYAHERENEIASPIATDYLELFEELTKDKLSNEEKDKFNKLVQCEFLIKQAADEKDNLTKIKLLNNALMLNPKSEEAFYALIVAHALTDDHNKALAVLEQAFLLPPSDSYRFLFWKAHVYKELGKVDEAETLFLKILEADKSHYGALIDLGALYYNKKNFAEALKYYQKLLEHYPDDSDSFNQMGNIMRVMGRYNEAFEYIYKALELQPQNPMATGTLAELYSHLGNHNEFYKNLELSFHFGINQKQFRKILLEEDIYYQYLSSKRFIDILDKYNFDLDFLSNLVKDLRPK